jgi:acetyltransferase-like isoleucine patch superfamily enzyme
MTLANKANTSVSVINGKECVVLYNTKIIEHSSSSRHVMFDTGNHKTTLTKERMNAFCKEKGLPFKIYVDNHVWYAQNTKSGVTKSFAGTICIMGY